MEKLLNARDVGNLLGISPKTVYRLAVEGKIPSIQLTHQGSVRFERAELVKWLNEKRRMAQATE